MYIRDRYYLHQQGVTRLDVVNYIAHGIKKSDPPEPQKSGESAAENEEAAEKNEKASPLEQYTQNLNAQAMSLIHIGRCRRTYACDVSRGRSHQQQKYRRD